MLLGSNWPHIFARCHREEIFFTTGSFFSKMDGSLLWAQHQFLAILTGGKLLVLLKFWELEDVLFPCASGQRKKYILKNVHFWLFEKGLWKPFQALVTGIWLKRKYFCSPALICLFATTDVIMGLEDPFFTQT